MNRVGNFLSQNHVVPAGQQHDWFRTGKKIGEEKVAPPLPVLRRGVNAVKATASGTFEYAASQSANLPRAVNPMVWARAGHAGAVAVVPHGGKSFAQRREKAGRMLSSTNAKYGSPGYDLAGKYTPSKDHRNVNLADHIRADYKKRDISQRGAPGMAGLDRIRYLETATSNNWSVRRAANSAARNVG